MSTSTANSVLEQTRRILSALPGWELSADTERMIREHDSFYWCGLSHPSYPGAEIGISNAREKGRLSISVRYPKDWEPYIDGRGRVYSESITVSDSKTPEQIARDIKKRLLEDTGYLAQLADCLARKHENEVGYREAETLARELAAMAGTATAYDRVAGIEHGCDHLKTNDNRKKFGEYGKVEGEVSHGAQSVELHFRNLSPEAARELLKAWNLTRAEL